MSCVYRHVQTRDGAYAVRYEFDHRGEGLPMHAHEERSLEHSVEVLLGSAMIYGPDRDNAVTLYPGTILVFDSSLSHEIAVLENHTVLLNRYRCGMPPEYASLPPEELAGIARLPPLTYQLEGSDS